MGKTTMKQKQNSKKYLIRKANYIRSKGRIDLNFTMSRRE